MTDETYMNIALEEAEKGLGDNQFPVGAILVVNGEIVSTSHKDESSNFHMDHAEMKVLQDGLQGKRYNRKKDNIVLYTTVEPCIMCWGAINHCPISKVVYGAKDKWGGATANIDLPRRHSDKIPEVVGGVLERQSVSKLRKYFENTDEKWVNLDNPLVKYVMEFKF